MIDESKLNLVCFRTLGKDEPWSLQTYLEVGGYSALKKILKEKTEQKRLSKKSRPPACVVEAVPAFQPA